MLDLVRRGLPNGEIGSLLDISVNTVRYHVSNMLSKLGLENRAELASWRPPERPRNARLAWLHLPSVAAGVTATLMTSALVGAAVLAGAGSGGGPVPTPTGTVTTFSPSPPSEDAAPATTAPSPTATAAPTVETMALTQDGEFHTYDAEALAAAGMIDAGTLFGIPDNPYPGAETMYREGFSLVRFPAAAHINLGASSGWERGFPPGVEWTAPDGVGLARSLGTERLFLSVWAKGMGAGPTRLLRGDLDSIEVYSQAAYLESPEIMIWAVDAAHRPLSVAVDGQGNVFISAKPIPDDAIITYDTGERLDLGAAEVLDMLPRPRLPSRTNWCGGDRPACATTVYFEGGSIPVSVGVLRCAGDDIEVVSEDLVINLHSIMGTMRPCSDATFASDQVRVAGWTYITATTADGEPAPIVTAPDGTFYSGAIEPALGCPCRAGS